MNHLLFKVNYAMSIALLGAILEICTSETLVNHSTILFIVISSISESLVYQPNKNVTKVL